MKDEVKIIRCQTCGRYWTKRMLELAAVWLMGYEKDNSLTTCNFCKQGDWVKPIKELEE